MTEPVKILIGDVRDGLRSLPAGSVQCCVTSPPYWGLRDYGVDGQIGLEPTPEAFVATMVEVFGEVRRVLRDDGTLWLNIGDSYAGSWGAQSRGPTTEGTLEGSSALWARQIAAARRDTAGTGSLKRTPGLKGKDLCMIPWRVALALQADGWYIRSVIVWAKKSPMPESVTDRPTSSWEPIFLLAKSDRYFYDAEAVKEVGVESGWNRQRQLGAGSGCKINGVSHDPNSTLRNDAERVLAPTTTRNQRNVWHLGPEPYSEAHFATFPSEIPRRAIKAGTSERGCCPACGAPWRRIVEKTQIKRERPNDYVKRDGQDGTGNSCANSVAGVESRTVGWEPTCQCPAHEPVPCVVLDPFLGSGTTIAVARQLGLHGVGCELNPQYAALARVRIGKAERPETFADPSKVIDAPLFGVTT